MVKAKYLMTRKDGVELMESYSDGNWKLRQVETNSIYGHSVVDVLVGYDGGEPYGRYTYIETDQQDEEEDDGNYNP